MQKHQKPRKQHLRPELAADGGLHEPRRRHPQNGVAEEHGKAEFVQRPRAVLHGERQAEEERFHIVGHVGKRELARLHAGELGQVVVAKLEDVAKARVVVGGVAGGHAQPRRQPRPQPRALFLFQVHHQKHGAKQHRERPAAHRQRVEKAGKRGPFARHGGKGAHQQKKIQRLRLIPHAAIQRNGHHIRGEHEKQRPQARRPRPQFARAAEVVVEHEEGGEYVELHQQAVRRLAAKEEGQGQLHKRRHRGKTHVPVALVDGQFQMRIVLPQRDAPLAPRQRLKGIGIVIGMGKRLRAQRQMHGGIDENERAERQKRRQRPPGQLPHALASLVCLPILYPKTAPRTRKRMARDARPPPQNVEKACETRKQKLLQISFFGAIFAVVGFVSALGRGTCPRRFHQQMPSESTCPM